MTSFSSRDRRLLLSGWLLCLLTAYFNIGFIAIDEYAEGLAVAVPAQHQAPWSEIGGTTIHPPAQRYLLAAIARAALTVGIESPSGQIRFILCLLGTLCFFTAVLSARTIFLEAQRPEEAQLSLALLSFFFLSPFVFSRLMVESISIPFVSVSLLYAGRYWRTGRTREVAISLAVLALGSMFRFQLGVCAGALLFAIGVRKDRRAALVFLATGVAAILVTGLLDQWMTGGFHLTIRNYVTYNLEAGNRHGVMAWYVFVALFFALSLPPTFLSRYRGFSWREGYRDLLPVVWFFLIFLLAHTLSPHKEERFAIPVLPAFLILLVPLLFHFRKRRQRWRRSYFAGLDLILLVFVCSSVPQKNIVGLAEALYRHPEIEKLISVDESIVLFPHAYAGRVLAIRNGRAAELADRNPFLCNEWIVVRRDLRERTEQNLEANFDPVGSFEPGLPERLAIRLNPGANRRRSAMDAYRKKGCNPVVAPPAQK